MPDPILGLTQVEIDAERKADRRAGAIGQIAQACIHRVDHGASKPLTLPEAEEAVAHPLTCLPKADLPALVAYLACQVVGYQHSQSADAKLAMVQIESIVDEWRKRHDK